MRPLTAKQALYEGGLVLGMERISPSFRVSVAAALLQMGFAPAPYRQAIRFS